VDDAAKAKAHLRALGSPPRRLQSLMLCVLEPPPPGVLDYGRVAEWIGTEDGVSNGKRIQSRRGLLRPAVHFHEPFDPQGLGGRKAIAAEARSRIEPAVEAALGSPARPFAFDLATVR